MPTKLIDRIARLFGRKPRWTLVLQDGAEIRLPADSVVQITMIGLGGGGGKA